MGWVRDSLEASKKKATAVYVPPTAKSQTSPNEILWSNIRDCIESDVLEFNMAGGDMFDVSTMDNNRIVQLIPKQEPIDTLKLEYKDGKIQLTCTISKPGVPRLATFEIKDGKVVFAGGLTGGPQPPQTPMSEEQFSEAVLKPFLFPEL